MRKTLLAFLMILCFSIPSMAAEIETPSVTKATAPEVETIVVVDEQGNVVEELETSTVTVTPVDEADAEETPDEVEERLTEAYEQLEEVESIADLPGEDVGETIDEQYGEGAADDLVVRELFDLQFSEEYEDYLQGGNKVTITFNTNIAKTETLVVIINYEGNKWMVIDKDDIVVNEDGTVSITFDEAISGPIAFLVEETPLSGMPTEGGEQGHTCPCWLCNNIWPGLCGLICGDICADWPFCPCWLVLLAIAILAVVIITIVIKKIKKNKKK